MPNRSNAHSAPRAAKSQLAVPARAVPPSNEQRQLKFAVWAALILLICIVYSDVGSYPFITFDDPSYVTENGHIRSGVTFQNIRWALGSFVEGSWVPLTLLSHMFVAGLFGLHSGAHHWVNVILHMLASLLLFETLDRATGKVWPSAFVAAVFALHPLHVESVAWISERKDVLSAFFWFLALYAYVRYTEFPSTRRYCLMAIAFLLGLLSKPMLVTFPFTLLLFDAWPLNRKLCRQTLVEKLPLFALSIAVSGVAWFALRSSTIVATAPFQQRTANALVSLVAYIGKSFWPTPLSLFYPARSAITLFQWSSALALLVVVSALAAFTWPSRRYIAVGWFWYLGTLFPVLGLVRQGIQSYADRYMYVPMVGLAIIVAWAMTDLVRKWPRMKPLIVTAFLFVAIACVATASAQASYWSSNELLYRQALKLSNNIYAAQYNLGDYLMDISGRADEGAHHFEEALRIDPNSAAAHNSIGSYLLQKGELTPAAAHFDAALRINPEFEAAHYNLGLVYERQGRIGEAVSQYQDALHSKPDFAPAYQHLQALLKLRPTTR